LFPALAALLAENVEEDREVFAFMISCLVASLTKPTGLSQGKVRGPSTVFWRTRCRRRDGWNV
jgi:hypothetical protein